MDSPFDATDAINVDGGANGANKSDRKNGDEEPMELNGPESSIINPMHSYDSKSQPSPNIHKLLLHCQ
jgi:hypothetical protein